MNERLPHQELQLLLGAYVLGGLDTADRRRVEEHLPGCQPCREELARFASIPALLRLAPALPSEPPIAPEDSLPRLISAARARRAQQFRRRWMLTAAAVLIVVAGVTGALLLTGRTSPDVSGAPGVVSSVPGSDGSVTVVSAFDAHQVGSAELRDRAWGTEVHLDLAYTPRDTLPYTAWVIDRAGHAEQAASWGVPPNGRCSVTGATSIHRAELDHIEVRTSDGRTVFRTRPT